MRTRFILIQTSHAGNVGAAARAMRVMGFDDLVLVAPRWPNVLRREETIQRASGALDVLRQARIVETLDEALDGISHLCATAMTPRDFGPPTRQPREHLSRWHDEPGLAQGSGGVAFLFGSERYGMRNDDVYRCHVCLSIPTAPDYGSLNLAAAVQLVAYEWRLALGGFGPVPAKRAVAGASALTPPAGSALEGPDADPCADAQALGGLLAHWQEALVAVDFLDPTAPKKLMPRLNQLLNRAQPTEAEVHILRGVARAMLRVADRAKR